MGGGQKVVQPTPPPAPSTAESIQAFVEAQPTLFQQQQEFAPQEIAQQLALLQQFGLPTAQAIQGIQAQLFPETSAIQEELAAESRAGIAQGAPEDVRERFRSDVAANLGTNVGSPIGATGTARALAELDEQFRQQSRNTALSLAGRQPLVQPQAPQFTNNLANFNPGQVLGFNAQNFGARAAASRPFAVNKPNYLSGASSLFGSLVPGGLYGAPGSGSIFS